MGPPATPAVCRVTLLAPGRRVDLALPVDVPLAELNPMVLELLGEPARSPARPDPWRFTGATGAALPSGATLGELGVLDGETLRLGPAAPPPPAPVFDDPVDALAALAPHARPGRRRPTAAVLAVTAAAAALLAAVPAGSHTRGAVALGGLAAAAALGQALRAARRAGTGTVPDEGPDGAPDGHRVAALVPACCAVPLAAAAGWAASPGPPGATHVLLAVAAAGTAAALGQVAVRVVAPVLLGAVVVAVLTGTAAAVGLRFDVTVPALAAVGAAVALAAGPLVPRAVLRLARLPRPVVPADAGGLVAADSGPDLLPPAELAERAHRARRQLAGLSGGLAVVAAGAAPPAAAAGGWTGPALAAVVVATLLLRARGFADAGPARVHLAVGIAAGVALVGLAAAASGSVGRIAGALVLLVAAALGIGALGRTPPPASPVVRRAADLAEAVLTAAAVPLALAAAGVFALVRNL